MIDLLKKALITGITGQDGILLSRHLHSLGYRVYGLIRGQDNPKEEKVAQYAPHTLLIQGDLTDTQSLIRALQIADPDEVYNLGAVSFVGLSWTQPEATTNITGLGALRLLEAIRTVYGSDGSGVKFYQAGSSEQFGQVQQVPQTEVTPFYPRSPYGSAKALAHNTTVNYRESYNMFAATGILFNHCQPGLRGMEFVDRKIASGVADIAAGISDHITLGNLDVFRDWTLASDAVQAMHLMLQHSEPDTFVIASGETHSLRDYIELAFKEVGLDDWQRYVRTDPRYVRPAEVDLLVGDPTKAKEVLGWTPTCTFPELVKLMVKAELEVRGI